jgi:hypothetical protein
MIFSPRKISHYLKTKGDNYMIMNDDRQHTKARFWRAFSYPAKKSADTFERIPGFVSCKKCFQTFAFCRTTGTSHLNNHICVSINETSTSLKGEVSKQPSIEQLWSSIDTNTKSVKLSDREKAVVKDLGSKWICQDIRPFAIVEDVGFLKLAQECVHLGESAVLLLIQQN